MKYKAMFKKWWFWFFSLSYPTFLFLIDITSPQYYINNPGELANPDYTIFIIMFGLRFLIALIILSILWFFFWKDKKNVKE